MVASVHPIAFDRKGVTQLADWLALGVAISLPWSTSATSILLALWVVVLVPTLDAKQVWRELMTPAGGLPVLLWLFAALGMMWANVSWAERFGGLDGYHRLLTIPLLLAQFRRSENGLLVLYGYLVSATCLLATSWAFGLIPALWLHGNFYGVPVKDYILQSDEFLVCGFALVGFAGEFAARQNWRAAVRLFALGALFLLNLAFVFTSRTGLLVAPFLIAALGWRLSGTKGVAIACAVGAVLAPVLWFSSPHLRDFAMLSINDTRNYIATDAVSSSGLHFEFLRKSAKIVADAPVIGHGTGSIAEQFRRTAAGQSGAAAVVSVNPHNQFFAVAIQLGCLGAAVLVAMWFAHFMLFTSGAMAWVGMVVVIDNVISSAVNSHLFDFGQGWLYVFGVGVTGGIVQRQRELSASPSRATFV